MIGFACCHQLCPPAKTLATQVSAAPQAQELAEFLAKLMDDALSAGDTASAAKLQSHAAVAARKARSIRLVRRTQAATKEIEKFREMAEKVASARRKLESNPNDPAACLVVGQQLCFVQGDWEQGLPMLVKGSDPKLRAAATKDLDMKSEDSASMIPVADAWYDIAGSVQGFPDTKLYFRIHSLYSKALPDTKGLTRVKLERRLVELDNLLQDKWEFPAIWAMVRAAVRNKTYEKTPAMGGAFSERDYEEIIPDGAILIGFHYTTKRFFDKDIVDCFQPIYLTPTGERLGEALGEFSKGQKQTVKAKPGYAVGRMAIRGGGFWGGVNVHFMRLELKGLNPRDTYESGWIGHKDQPNAPFVGDGRLIVGIHGRLQPKRDGEGACSIGFHLVGEKPTINNR